MALGLRYSYLTFTTSIRAASASSSYPKIGYLVGYARLCSPMLRVLLHDNTSIYTCLLSIPMYRRFHFYVALVGKFVLNQRRGLAA